MSRTLNRQLDIAASPESRSKTHTPPGRGRIAMTLQDAIAINDEVVSFCIARLWGDKFTPLSRDYGLKEIIEARDMVEAHNGSPSENKPGSIIMRTVPDDRLIAAMYAMLNYEPQPKKNPEPILMGIDRALVCLRIHRKGK
jgi:hypothetical protein